MADGLIFTLPDPSPNSEDGFLLHDSFRAAKAKRRRRGAAPPSSREEERPLIFRNARLVDPTSPPPAPLVDVTVQHGVVIAICPHDPTAAGAEPPTNAAAGAAVAPPVVVDCRGRHLVPGLMDAHVHCTAVIADLAALRASPPSLIAARAAHVLSGMLSRGFTTVRDAGGADWGLAAAVDEGAVLGPRVLFSGRALSATGGHGDFRPRGQEVLECGGGGGGGGCPCACAAAAGIGRVCDGDAAVRRAAREELRLGSSWVKLMASGGVSSPTDSLEHSQFSEGELRAACEEARARGCYAGAHAYMPHSIRRAVRCGARSIEHGNFLDEETAREMAAAGAFLVPTLVTYWAIVHEGREGGFPASLIEKAKGVSEAGARSLRIARGAGVRVCFGSDLLGPMHEHQAREFLIRHESGGASAAELLRSATTECAALFQREGELGRVAVGAAADFFLCAADPREEVSVLASEKGRRVECVVKDGLVAKSPSVEFGAGINAAVVWI